jgi:hypothetical protein
MKAKWETFLELESQNLVPSPSELTQTGLIDKLLKSAGLEECRGVSTPAETKTMGSDLEGALFDEEWDYA